MLISKQGILRDIMKFRGDTYACSFEIPPETESLLFIARNEQNAPLLSLDSDSDFLKNEGGTGTLLLCHPHASSFAHDSSVYIGPNGHRRLFFAISATTSNSRTIVLRGDYILWDDVITGGVYETFMPPTPSFEGLPYAILQALTYATHEGVPTAELIPSEIVTEADARRAEIALTIQKMKRQGVLPVQREFETHAITHEVIEASQVVLAKKARPETLYLRIAGVPHQQQGKDYTVKDNVILLSKGFIAKCLNLYMNVSYLAQ